MLALVDNTVLSNFALVDEVLNEFASGVTSHRLPPTDLSCLMRLTLSEMEEAVRFSLRRQLGLGDAACLAVAFFRGGSVFTDDRSARKVATQMQVTIHP